MENSNRLIIALDVSSRNEAERILDQLKGEINFYKVGLQLYTAVGPSMIHTLKKRGLKVFLDLKFHDIPQTVSNAGIEAIKLGVDMFTIHTAGGLEMMKQCREQCSDFSEKEGTPLPKILGVTALTSTDSNQGMKNAHDDIPIGEQVLQLSRLAKAAGLHGVIAPPPDLPYLRKEFPPPFLLGVPGIRPTGSETNDQKRISTPREAIQWGGDFLVIGRPILQSPNPHKKVREILKEIADLEIDKTVNEENQ